MKKPGKERLFFLLEMRRGHSRRQGKTDLKTVAILCIHGSEIGSEATQKDEYRNIKELLT